MKKYLLLLAMVCVLGNGVLAQTKSSSNASFTHEIIDFTQLEANGGLGDPSWDGNFFVSQNGTSISFLSTKRISVSNTNGWNIWMSSTNNDCSYLQRASEDVRNVVINNLNVGDIVRIWCAGECRILTDNTATHDSSNPLVWNHKDPDPNYAQRGEWGGYDDRAVNDREGIQLQETFGYDVNNPSPTENELKIVNDHDNGTLVIRLAQQWAGIIKIEIDAVQTSPQYDYDPGFEVYDMFETRNNAGNTSYSANESAGFTLNNKDAKYLKFTNNDLSLNERIAIDPTSIWGFARGLQAPGYSVSNDSWYNLSICNLREGDRVVIYYTGDAPIFSSNGKNGDYTGNAAYKDTWNDGMLDTSEGDHRISQGDPVEYSYCRKEGNIVNDEDNPHIWLYTSYPYVMMENGHLDLALKNGNYTRIVKIKIYSDHQAMMVDDYNNTNYTYTSYFNITGELQANEHIVPGGLEVHVGSDEADQHANVVFSKDGPVSYVKAVDGYKLPGTTKVNGEIQRNFNLANEAPETGTYYRFIPETSGKMTVKFKATSLNYYRWDLPGDAIYYDDGGWTLEFDRANEWPLKRSCPYYLKVQDGNQYYQPNNIQVSYDDGVNFSALNSDLWINNGQYCILTLDVVAGKTYYLYGAWSGRDNYQLDDPRNSDTSGKDACGVAELLWVKFAPDNSITPLAKWVPNGTTAVYKNSETDKSGVPNPDTFVEEYELADVVGYVGAQITVKKMSGNIIECNPYIKRANPQDREGKLVIDGIKFAKDASGKDKNKGGTILIKIGDPSVRTNPVYALTIAYSTDSKYDNEQGSNVRGHVWDFSTNSLNGLEWLPDHYETVDNQQIPVYVDNGAQPKTYGTYFEDYFRDYNNTYKSADEVLSSLSKSNNNNYLLYKEMTDPDGSDWMFNYNLVYGGNLYDPVFSNKYDMEGDNADMIWDTEGTVFQTSANQSCIFNEYGKTVSHASTETVDPDRYVGFFEGGKFRIPWLMKDDRVIIYMGTGKGRYADEVKFKIKHAYDALHNVISENDEYIVGGSHWDGAKGDPNYRGCYHFFAAGDGKGGPADMVFEMTSGSMCKIYKIQIYRGDRIITNDIVGETANDKFLLVSTAADPNEVTSETNKDYTEENRSNWTLQYFGKDQKLADGSNSVNNDIVAQTGDIKSSSTFSTNATNNTFTYQHQLGEIGTIRVRGKDMEKNMKYVADYGEHNVTIAYQQTQKYPYTWDFKDMTGWGGDANTGNKAALFDKEDAIQPSTTPPAGYDTEKAWTDSYEFTSRDLSLWEIYTGTNGYYLRLNSQNGQTSTNPKEKDNIFQTDSDTDSDYAGNQVWANGQVVPETQGLWFLTNNNFNHSSWYITDDGMEFCEKSHKLVVPNVPAGAAVYLRMEKTRDENDFSWQWNNNCEVYGNAPQKVGSTDDYIFAILNKGSKRNLVLSLKGYRLLKLAVSTDSKTVNAKGWASESRDHVIDPELTAYMTGYDLETCIVTDVDYDSKTVTLTRVHSIASSSTGSNNNTANNNGVYVMRALSDGDKGASIIHNKADGVVEILSIGTAANSKKGFHLFVPDMHDYTEGATNNQKSLTHEHSESNKNLFVAQVSAGTIPASSGDYTNYALSYKYYKLNPDGTKTGSQQEGDEAFYRIAYNTSTGGASSNGNQGYLPMLTSRMNPYYVANTGSNNGNTNPAKFTIVFEDAFGDVAPGITTTIDDASQLIDNGQLTIDNNADWYNLNGQKLNGVPTQKGLYIMNGRKVLVK